LKGIINGIFGGSSGTKQAGLEFILYLIKLVLNEFLSRFYSFCAGLSAFSNILFCFENIFVTKIWHTSPHFILEVDVFFLQKKFHFFLLFLKL